MIYLIAYKKKDGNDFMGQPYILGDFNNLDECKANAQQLIGDGYCYVTVFECARRNLVGLCKKKQNGILNMKYKMTIYLDWRKL